MTWDGVQDCHKYDSLGDELIKRANKGYIHKVSVIAVIYKDHKFLMGRRLEKDGGYGQYVFPGGKLKPEESFEEALIREVKEEVGLDIRVGGVITATRSAHAGKSNVGIVFFAQVLSQESPVGSKEIADPQWYTFDEAQQLDVMPVTREVFTLLDPMLDTE